tara:strand:+ start:585 stop:869 length:285 start_codon:yes stop_codon:yes gene_type:complete
MKRQREWSYDEDLLVISTFSKRYKSDQWADILLDLTKEIKTSKASIRARIKSYNAFMLGRTDGLQDIESMDLAIKEVMSNQSLSKSKMSYILEP